MKIIYTRHFVKLFENYNKADQEIIYNTVEETLKYIKSGQTAYGLRVKKLHTRIYESRININLRLVYFRENAVVKFFCVGNHDDIRRCLKRLRQLL